jgi:DNA-binding response OmpR family regulator
VLLIEDDARIRHLLRLALAQEGFTIHEAPTGEEGLEAVTELELDLVCLDLMLPGTDGFQVCRDIRRDSDVPIVLVTARTDSHDVVGGLEAGADDYISKPFRVPELAARIRALLRRADGARLRDRVRAGDVEILARDGLVMRGGKPVALTRTEFRLLCQLAEEPGRVLSREDLLDRVWGCDYFGDSRLVDVHIGRLRRKVESDPREPQVVLTMRGLGYRLAV